MGDMANVEDNLKGKKSEKCPKTFGHLKLTKNVTKISNRTNAEKTMTKYKNYQPIKVPHQTKI